MMDTKPFPSGDIQLLSTTRHSAGHTTDGPIDTKYFPSGNIQLLDTQQHAAGITWVITKFGKSDMTTVIAS